MDEQEGEVNHMLAATNPLHGAAQHHSNPLVDLAAHAKQVPLLSQAECAHVSRVCTRSLDSSCFLCMYVRSNAVNVTPANRFPTA